MEFLVPYLINKLDRERFIDEDVKYDIKELIDIAKNNDIKIFPFKRRTLPRITAVLKDLKGLDGSTVLDVGTGRGTSIYPILSEFYPDTITCMDINLKALTRLYYVAKTHEYISPIIWDIQDSYDEQFDIVLALEVLEHIPNVNAALENIWNCAKRFIFISVPSKEDDNPEHIHLLTKDFFDKFFKNKNVKEIKYSFVNGHMILKIKK